MFSFRFDASSRLLHIHMRGLWHDAVIDEYMIAFGRQIECYARLRMTIGILVDGRGTPVQRPDMAARFQALPTGQPGSGPPTVVAVAIVSDAALNRLQVRRLYGDALGIFATIEEATTYLTRRLERAQPVIDAGDIMTGAHAGSP